MNFFSNKNGTEDNTINSSSLEKKLKKRVNSITKNENDDYSSVKQYIKVINKRVNKQNLHLSKKFVDIFKEDNQASSAKIFTAINELNKINLNNSSALVQVFPEQTLKYNDSVRIFIQQSEKKSSNHSSLIPLSI